uniref:Cytidyltransferase-like domain-containing protein n=1 Tax=Aplanochytrium stocchinoi TaxID=215587 RepID=A0A7S3PGK1_9STRA|mmetsp:Transcript_26324/g.32072  ORF Transcript_26324/g.32072 Transcript_26324/m.32072 type:complete len:228 (-) Transcript_26324:318-1001(-)|eukprot:CAMPEP_0204838652 /NCGR_PEP_ID=MMETSP1346-20131115/31474_1 /ASSEMBLY_ACC=CAM_ASM_000771 /TAXON_ID=215587 /ORGANISM="Aplanochytrium stocchinoi, Strain GSBS06" /LENGTH=227 /DNA_ID=CAMNT_0051974839 /DNA_START=162 /DNA_END=845 /DNA_ORIENTATION=-
MARRNILFMRGSFDPPTLGHKALLQGAIEMYSAKECVVVINDSQERGKRFKAPASLREEMVRALFDEAEIADSNGQRIKMRICISTDDKKVDYHMLKTEEYPNDVLIMATGLDMLYLWKQYVGYIDKVCVAERDCTDCSELEKHDKETLLQFENLVDELNRKFPCEDKNETRVDVLKLDDAHGNTSSSFARKLLADDADKEASHILTPQVLKIARNSGYYSKNQIKT